MRAQGVHVPWPAFLGEFTCALLAKSITCIGILKQIHTLAMKIYKKGAVQLLITIPEHRYSIHFVDTEGTSRGAMFYKAMRHVCRITAGTISWAFDGMTGAMFGKTLASLWETSHSLAELQLKGDVELNANGQFGTEAPLVYPIVREACKIEFVGIFNV